MKRVKGTAGVSPLECINPKKNRWAVRLDVQNDTDGGEGAVTYVEEVYEHEPTIEDIRSLVCQAIEAYDTSNAVNTSMLGGKTTWFDNLNRTSLLEVARNAAVADETATIEVWTDGSCMNVKATDLTIYLIELIGYAKATFDVTQHHKLDVHTIEDKDELLSYDVRAGYPPILDFKLSD